MSLYRKASKQLKLQREQLNCSATGRKIARIKQNLPQEADRLTRWHSILVKDAVKVRTAKDLERWKKRCAVFNEALTAAFDLDCELVVEKLLSLVIPVNRFRLEMIQLRENALKVLQSNGNALIGFIDPKEMPAQKDYVRSLIINCPSLNEINRPEKYDSWFERIRTFTDITIQLAYAYRRSIPL